MPIRPGRYIITNAEYWNLVFLSDNSDGTSLQACLKEDVPGQEWNVSEHGKGRYSISNFGQKMWASAGFRPQQGEHVVGREGLRLWLVKKHDSTGNYTIATADDKLRWWLDDSEPATPITLHSAPPSDPRCHWNFQRIGHVDTALHEAANEEVVVAARAELARKAREVEEAKQEAAQVKDEMVRILEELEASRREVAQTKALATENAKRRKEAEAEASRKAAGFEEAKIEAAVAKSELARKSTEVKQLKREVTQAKEEVSKKARELDAANTRLKEVEAAQKVAAEAVKKAVPVEAGGNDDEDGGDISEGDVKLVMSQTGCTRKQAIKALKDNGGDIINAIMAAAD